MLGLHIYYKKDKETKKISKIPMNAGTSILKLCS